VNDLLDITLLVAETLEHLGVPYLVGGSLASSLHGVFIPKDDPASRQEMARRRAYVVSDDSQKRLMVASPEDIMVQKLYWYRLGAGVSDRQWNDVLGVMKVQGTQLDQGYLQRIASLRVHDNLHDVRPRTPQTAPLRGLSRSDWGCYLWVVHPPALRATSLKAGV